jgi:hypothetical protein
MQGGRTHERCRLWRGFRYQRGAHSRVSDTPCILEIERFAVRAMSDGNYGFSGEAVDALRLRPCTLDRPPAFFANTVEYHRRESLHHKVGLARMQGRGNRSSA